MSTTVDTIRTGHRLFNSEVNALVVQIKKFPIYDFFFGEDWLTWSRYLFKKGKLIYIGGNKLTDKTILSALALQLSEDRNSNL